MTTAWSGLNWTNPFSNVSQIGFIQGPTIDDHVAVGFHIHDDIADRRALFFRRSCFRDFHVELVFVPGRVPGQQKKNQEQTAARRPAARVECPDDAADARLRKFI